jgi:mRNA interferase MazF
MVKLEMNKQNQLTKTSAADCFQVRSVSTDRIVDKVGELSESDMAQITQGLATVLKIT